jgi:phage gp36-like protein|tara:strand:- start:5302 stop:5799 length:498 start_codon:yes stop_codon:yes gene_type:complete
MSYYTSVANVYTLYPRVGSLSSVNSASVSFYIDQAENEINAYVVNNYTTPFSSSIPTLTTISTEYALVKILERFFTQEVQSENSWVRERKEYVFDLLNKINSGEIGLYTSSLELITYNAGDTIYSNTMNYNPTFTMLDETMQQIDSDRLQDEWDAVRLEEYSPYY